MYRRIHSLLYWPLYATNAALYIVAINGYIFTDLHPDTVFNIALYGSLLAAALMAAIIIINRTIFDRIYHIRGNLVPYAVTCWAIPGIILTPEAHYPILGIIFTAFITLSILRGITRWAADYREEPHPDEITVSFLDTPTGKAYAKHIH